MTLSAVQSRDLGLAASVASPQAAPVHNGKYRWLRAPATTFKGPNPLEFSGFGPFFCRCAWWRPSNSHLTARPRKRPVVRNAFRFSDSNERAPGTRKGAYNRRPVVVRRPQVGAHPHRQERQAGQGDGGTQQTPPSRIHCQALCISRRCAAPATLAMQRQALFLSRHCAAPPSLATRCQALCRSRPIGTA
jgi:hypothetical protein